MRMVMSRAGGEVVHGIRNELGDETIRFEF